MDQKPWYQKRKADAAFPFLLREENFRHFSFHWHELIEIVYVQRGKIVVVIDGQAHESRPGDVLIISPGIIHGFFDAVPETSILVYQIGLEIFEQTLVDIRDQVYQNLVFERKAAVTPSDGGLYQCLKRLLFSIQKEYNEQKAGFRLAIKSKFYELALVFIREIESADWPLKKRGRRAYYNGILERIFSFVHDNSGDQLTLEQAAGAAAMSKFYFTRFFKEQTGQTFHAYLSRIRVAHAEELLVETGMSITDIAYLCGFGSLKTFNRVFKTYAGISPSQYRFGKSCPAGK